MKPIEAASVKVGGAIGERVELTWKGNLLKLDWENDFLAPFAGKHSPAGFYVGLGKTFDGLARFAAHSGDASLLALRRRVLDMIIATQLADGYMGAYAVEDRTLRLWDIHEQVYLLLALVTDWVYFGEPRSLEAARKLGDYLLAQLAGSALDKAPGSEAWGGLAPHLALLGLDRALLALYRATGERRYLDFCVARLKLPEWDLGIVEGRFPPLEGHMYAYLARCLAQVELYEITRDESLLRQTRRALDYLGRQRALVITGTCSIEECWHSDQTGSGLLGETCATAYLIRLLFKLLTLEGDGGYGDWMERAIYNALFAAQSPDGRKLRYYTPFEGPREYWDRDTYCCPGNFRRIVSELPGMIAFEHEDGLTVNLYTESEITVVLADGTTVLTRQRTEYPSSGRVALEISPSRAASFSVRLRKPAWCRNSSLRVNGAETAAAGKHFVTLKREWKAGDTIEFDMEMPWRLVRGFGKQEGRVAVMRGPVVFCLNPNRNPALSGRDLKSIVLHPETMGAPVPDGTVRPNGIACRVTAFSSIRRDRPDLDLLLTEFPDPGGEAICFLARNPDAASPDELHANGLHFAACLQ